jgi:hypothetical protein
LGLVVAETEISPVCAGVYVFGEAGSSAKGERLAVYDGAEDAVSTNVLARVLYMLAQDSDLEERKRFFVPRLDYSLHRCRFGCRVSTGRARLYSPG